MTPDPSNELNSRWCYTCTRCRSCYGVLIRLMVAYHRLCLRRRKVYCVSFMIHWHGRSIEHYITRANHYNMTLSIWTGYRYSSFIEPHLGLRRKRRLIGMRTRINKIDSIQYYYTLYLDGSYIVKFSVLRHHRHREIRASQASRSVWAWRFL